MKRVIDGVAACLALAAASLAAPAQMPPAPATQPPAQLTLAQAERIAIKNNPNIGIAHLLTLAQSQVAREAHSASMPTLVGDITAVGAHNNTRITAGVLNNPSVYDRAAGGLTVSELITDFGRTHNLVLSAKSAARAQLENERATQQDKKPNFAPMPHDSRCGTYVITSRAMCAPRRSTRRTHSSASQWRSRC